MYFYVIYSHCYVTYFYYYVMCPFVSLSILIVMYRSVYSVSLCCSVYLCVNVYRTIATGCQPNCN
jgi:hypothetical protein